MSHALYHSRSSSRSWGGDDLWALPLHNFFDQTKIWVPDNRHRALLHHSGGIALAEQVFGPTILTSEGRQVPTRSLGEQHVHEDLGRVPTPADWMRGLPLEPWMERGARKLSQELA